MVIRPVEKNMTGQAEWRESACGVFFMRKSKVTFNEQVKLKEDFIELALGESKRVSTKFREKNSRQWKQS